VRGIVDDERALVVECCLSLVEPNAVLALVGRVLANVPGKPKVGHLVAAVALLCSGVHGTPADGC